MSAVETLRMARECGVRFDVTGGDLILDADQEPATRVLDAIRRNKAGIITLLTHRPEGAPPEWTAGVERLLTLPSPDGVASERWRTLLDDAVRFTETWGAQAAKLGWETADVFGVNRTKLFVRLDAAGLVRLLDGRPVAALTESEAAIQCRGGNRLTFRRKLLRWVPAAEQCLLWEPPRSALALGQKLTHRQSVAAPQRFIIGPARHYRPSR